MKFKWKWLLLFGIGALLAYEWHGISDTAPGDTISEHFWAWSESSDLVPFAWGVLAGHFVWQRKVKR